MHALHLSSLEASSHFSPCATKPHFAVLAFVQVQRAIVCELFETAERLLQTTGAGGKTGAAGLALTIVKAQKVDVKWSCELLGLYSCRREA